jgi:hypothetical protein
MGTYKLSIVHQTAPPEDGVWELDQSDSWTPILVIIFRCSSSPSNPVYARRVDSSALVFSLSSYRQPYIGFVYISRFIDS